MTHTDVVVIGGGQAGLAMSRCLSDLGIDHVVLERGRVAERWRTERWESLRLLTPNWLSRLPGFRYEGPDPDGFMTTGEVVGYLQGYARSFSPPFECQTTVEHLSTVTDGYQVMTNRGGWRARSVVIATGYSDVPRVPRLASGLSPDVYQIVPTSYRSPEHVPPGGVLVVGASATGVQLAEELRHAGRDVTIAAGHHLRMPRRYRGRDVMWWLDRTGLFDATVGDVYDVDISRSQPSFQLVGRPDHRSIGLKNLQMAGVRVVGHLTGAEGHRVAFADDLVKTTVASDAKLALLLQRFDEFSSRHGLDADVGKPEPFVPVWQSFTDAATGLNLHAEGIGTVIWATGYRRQYPWLHVPVLDGRGEIRHTGGVTPSTGLYVLGMQFQRQRNSNFIDGVGRDALWLSRVIGEHLGQLRRRAGDRRHRMTARPQRDCLTLA